MKIQSLSVVVPTERCINDCKFCVSKMHHEAYENNIGPVASRLNKEGHASKDYLVIRDYVKRIEFVRDAGCNTAILTGTGEPQQNMHFIDFFCYANRGLVSPFRKIEIQTTGVGIDDEKLRLLREWGITTISLSLSSFDSKMNAMYNGTHPSAMVGLEKFCKSVKEHGFTLRLSINLTDCFDVFENNPGSFFFECDDRFNADQVTLRVLYADKKDTEQAEWIAKHGAWKSTIDALDSYIRSQGRELEKLEFGYTKYSVGGMGVVVDTDCMSTTPSSAYRYLVLRPDCHLYSKWDDLGSLVF